MNKFFYQTAATAVALVFAGSAHADFSTNKVKIDIKLRGAPVTAAAIAKKSKAKVSIGEVVGGTHKGEIDIKVDAKGAPITAVAVGPEAEALIKIGSLREKD